MTSIPDADRAVVREILNAGSVDETLRENLALLEHAAAAAERDGFSNYAGTLRKHLEPASAPGPAATWTLRSSRRCRCAAAYEQLSADTGLARPRSTPIGAAVASRQSQTSKLCKRSPSTGTAEGRSRCRRIVRAPVTNAARSNREKAEVRRAAAIGIRSYATLVPAALHFAALPETIHGDVTDPSLSRPGPLSLDGVPDSVTSTATVTRTAWRPPSRA